MLVSSTVWAGGNGTGTMSPNMNSTRLLTQNGVVFYQGQINDNIYFQYGNKVGKQWKIEQHKMDVETVPGTQMALDFMEALEKSKVTKSWFPIRSNE